MQARVITGSALSRGQPHGRGFGKKNVELHIKAPKARRRRKKRKKKF